LVYAGEDNQSRFANGVYWVAKDFDADAEKTSDFDCLEYANNFPKAASLIVHLTTDGGNAPTFVLLGSIDGITWHTLITVTDHDTKGHFTVDGAAAAPIWLNYRYFRIQANTIGLDNVADAVVILMW